MNITISSKNNIFKFLQAPMLLFWQFKSIDKVLAQRQVAIHCLVTLVSGG
jgi:hypothetical protein